MKEKFTDSTWDTLASQSAANPSLAQSILGADFDAADFAQRMHALGLQQKIAEAARKAKARRERPMSTGKIRDYMRHLVKNQRCAISPAGYTKKYV